MTKKEEISFEGGKRKLPDGWQWVKLKNVCLKITDGTHHSPPNGREGIPYITAKNIRPFRLDLTKLTYVSPEDHVEIYKRCDPKPGDVLYIKDGVTMGIAAVNRLEYEFSMLSSVALLRPNPKILDSDFFAICLNAPDTFNSVTADQSGSAIRRIVLRQIEEIQIPLPPLNEQKRIAAILNEKMEGVEEARKKAIAQLEAAKDLPAAYLRAVFNSPEAQQWQRKTLDKISELLPAKSISTDGDVEVFAITTACLTETGFDPSGIKKARMWAKDAAECVVYPGEILIARSNTLELVGRVSMFAGEIEGVVATDLTIRILPKLEIQPPFFAAYLSYLYLSGYWKERSGGASWSMKKITRSQLFNEKIPTPSLAEQQKITATLNKLLSEVKKLRKTLESQLEAINQLPAALLRQAFNGEL